MKKKSVLFIMLVILLGAGAFALYKITKVTKTHIIICNVGQGDGIFIQTRSNKKYLIDGGPDSKILNCIGRKSPFKHDPFDAIIISHLHADHIVGAIEVAKRYGSKTILTNSINYETPEVKELFSQVSNQKIVRKEAYKNDILNFRY